MAYLLCRDKLELDRIEEEIGPLIDFSLIWKESGGCTPSILRLGTLLFISILTDCICPKRYEVHCNVVTHLSTAAFYRAYDTDL